VAISRRVRYRLLPVRFAALSFGGVVLAAGFGAPASSLAQAPAPAVPAKLTKEFQAGVDAYRLGKYDDARAHLDKAQAIDPKLPGPHRFLAAVARAQHRWSDCIAEARRALELNPHSQEIAETRKLHDDCRAGDGRPAYGSALGDGAAIAIMTTNVTGATVRIAGLRYGGTPVEPRLIKPGTLEVAIDKQGYKPAHLTIEALPGIVTDVVIELEAVAAKSTPPPSAPPSAKPGPSKQPAAKLAPT
jgi:tetratricopeptide (TPR) repeat protein